MGRRKKEVQGENESTTQLVGSNDNRIGIDTPIESSRFLINMESGELIDSRDKIENITRIEQVSNRGYHTLIRWKRDLGFPMFKEGGQWVMFREDYKIWVEKQRDNKNLY